MSESMELTTPEAIRLEQCEDAIQRCADVFDAATQALATIRDDRLYREQYRTFDEYCERRWGYTRQHTNRLIAAADVMESLRMEPIGSKPDTTPFVRDVVLPANEAQARPLAQIQDPEERREVWQEVVRIAPDGKVTAKHVESVVKERRVPKASKVVEAKDTDEIAVMHSLGLDALREIATDLAYRATQFRQKAEYIIEGLGAEERPVAVTLIAAMRDEVSVALDSLSSLTELATR